MDTIQKIINHRKMFIMQGLQAIISFSLCSLWQFILNYFRVNYHQVLTTEFYAPVIKFPSFLGEFHLILSGV